MINHLVSIVRRSDGLIDDVLDDSKRKETIEWIGELDGILSVFRIGDNAEILLSDLVQMLRGDGDDDDDDGSDSDDESQIYDTIPKPKTYQKKIYFNISKLIRESSKKGNSEYVYKGLAKVMKSITSKSGIGSYESLCLVGTAFSALIDNFQHIKYPEKDRNHNFTIAIDNLSEIVENVSEKLTDKEKDDTIRWMMRLHVCVETYALGDIAEVPLVELIRMVRKS